MTFLEERKKEIIEYSYKSSCCRRALLSGILYAKGIIDNGNVTVRVENTEIALFLSSLVKEFYGKDITPVSSNKGGRGHVFAFHSPSAEKFILSLTLEDSNLFVSKCAFCRTAFLRGVFLVSARLSDPDKKYRIEFSPKNNIQRLQSFLENLGIPMTLVKRRNENYIYTSNSGLLEDLFAALAMNNSAFELINQKIKNEFKNTANRIRNCETNNIEKTVSASLIQRNAIEALERANLLSSLSEELELTARLRLEFKDYSLARLAAEFSPPISKSGLSHRLNKLVEIAEEMLGREK